MGLLQSMHQQTSQRLRGALAVPRGSSDPRYHQFVETMVPVNPSVSRFADCAMNLRGFAANLEVDDITPFVHIADHVGSRKNSKVHCICTDFGFLKTGLQVCYVAIAQLGNLFV